MSESRLIDHLRAERGLIVVITGAGISVASGIPTFRGNDPGAIWRRDVTAFATLGAFERDPAATWRWYRQRFVSLLEAKPNPGHAALAALERWQLARGGDFLLVTQNIDTLHDQSGVLRLVKVHGSADRVRCTSEGCRLGPPAGSIPLADVDFAPFDRDPRARLIPRCPACAALVRPHVLWFDELYASHDDYQWERVLPALERMKLALFVGTSFAVGLTEAALDAAAARRVPTFSIDPAAAPESNARVTHLRAPAEEILPSICAVLGAPLESG